MHPKNDLESLGYLMVDMLGGPNVSTSAWCNICTFNNDQSLAWLMQALPWAQLTSAPPVGKAKRDATPASLAAPLKAVDPAAGACRN